jgi:hypothetical protein
MRINPEEKQKIYKQAKHRLGAPIRKIQLEDEQMDSLLEIATEDYVEYIQNYITEHQWPALIGLDVNEADLTRAFMTRSQDFVTQYTYSYSKIVGLGAGEGGYVLKKDYIELRKNVQMYEIPAHREINEVLWFTPSTIDQSIIDPFIGVWSNNFGGEYIGLGSYYIMPAFDILMRASDRNLKNRLIRSELIYKVTNAPDGKKYIHLMNTPGGSMDFRNSLFNQGKVWYWYYDTNEESRAECLAKNKDIIKSPSDVPFDSMSFDDLNEPSKVWVRRYFIALAKETLGRVRGTFGGKIPIPNADMTVEYESLLTEGKDEMITLKKELEERLARLSPLETLKRASEEATHVNETLKYRAFQKPIKLI